jgi:hypothetical protein
LRQAQATVERRDVLDVDLREAESQLGLLPSVMTTDPQADTAVRLISWMTFGLITVTSNDIHLARIAGMTLVPQLAGLVLMLAATLWQSRGQARDLSIRPTFRRSGRRSDAPGSRPSTSTRLWSDREEPTPSRPSGL